ncbi:MAG: class I adenylate cyclase [Oleiphilaceae bacterium]|nr:class I adenylate cyclase [Oleiphilaceae bacterium]
MTALKQALKPDFSDGVDRKQLKQIRDRFMQVNADRLRKTHEGLNARQRDILAVLPLLYQVNHPLLPGYVSQDSPRGVAGYQPDKETLIIAKSFSQTFKFRADKRHPPQVQSLFIMGSTGTLAHSESSDVDMWLCHAPNLTPDELDQLQQKAQKIDEWANDSGLELHTFLMNAEAFRQGVSENELDAESSGSAQHYLLLDEFYRTAILLAGCYPLWWLVPPHLEARYSEITDLLLSKRFVPQKEVIDFGSAAHIPKSELVGAGLWQLYKGLDAPYKSVLKLLLAEVYAQELPAVPSLSVQFKQSVYADELKVEQLDPYLLVYRRLESYLTEQGELKRLDLVRKSFYLKVNKKLSRPPAQRRASWQRQVLEKVCAEWFWPDNKFRYLDDRQNWKVDQVLQERKEVFAELSHSYRFLSRYARENDIASAITAEDLSLLGRKLYATFQKKAGKIERVNPGIAPNLWEENLAIHHASTSAVHADKQGWLLYRDLASASEAAFHPTLKKSSSLMELVAWLYLNGLLTRATRLSLVPGVTQATQYEIQGILQVLGRHLPLPLPTAAQSAFQRAPYPKEIILFVNVGIDPMHGLMEPGLQRLSERTDVLGYSSKRHNLVKSIDQVSLNSWHEASVHRFEKGELLLQALQAYLQSCARHLAKSDHRLSVYCFCPHRAEAIAKRVQHLFDDARSAVIGLRSVQSQRFVIEIEEYFYILSCIDGQFRFKAYQSEEAMLDALSQRRTEFSSIVLDRYALPHDTLLRNVLAHNRANEIQVFYASEGGIFDVIVLDEMGSVYRYFAPHTSERRFCFGLNVMLQRMLEKRQLNALFEEPGAQAVPKVVFERVTRSGGEFESKRLKEFPELPHVEVTAMGYFDGDLMRFDLQCEGQEFAFYDYGERQFKAMQHKLQREHSGEGGVLQIVDIVFPDQDLALGGIDGEHYGTLDYVRAYHQLENQMSATA